MSEFPVMIKRLKGQGIVRVAAKHNLREIASEIGAAGKIDPTRIHTNLVLRGPTSADSVAADAKALTADAGITRQRVGSVMALELVFTLPPNTGVDVREYFEDATQWAESFYQVPLLSSVVHLDEAAPHCHVLLLPIVDGRMVGSDLHGGRTKLIAMQAAFQEQVRARHGMARYAPAKRHSAAVRSEAMRQATERLLALGWPEAIVMALFKIEARDPEPLLLALGLSMPAPAPRQSFVAMMTRPTKPDPQNPIGKAHTNPIGKAGRVAPKVMLPYPCVGKGFTESASGDPEQRKGGRTEPTSASASPPTTEACGRANSGAGEVADQSDYIDEPAERYTRERDSDYIADTWDSERGEFGLSASKQPSRKASAEGWVERKLNALGNQDRLATKAFPNRPPSEIFEIRGRNAST